MKIALFHNVGAGGAKRALFEHVRGLAARGHTIDLFIPASACESYLPLAPLCHSVKVYGGSAGDPAGPREGGEGAVRRLARGLLGDVGHDLLRDTFWARKQRRRVAEQAQYHAVMAGDILRGNYDLLYAHQCGVMLAPDLVRLVADKLPTVFYVQDTLRRVEEWTFADSSVADYDVTPTSFLRRKWRGRVLSPVLLAWMRREEARFVENLRAASIVCVNSRFSQEGILRTTGVRAKVCYLGVDSTYFTPPEKNASRLSEVLSVGALRTEKRHELVIDAVARIPLSLPRPRVRIVGYELPGADSLGSVLCRRAQELGVELTIEREVTDDTVRDAYRRARVVAFTPYLEPFGLVPLEAMACETPVVAVAEGGPRETTQDGVTGFLADADPTAFGNAILRILEDEEQRQKMGGAGRRWVQDAWTWERSVNEVEAILMGAATT